jgi:Kef-type K+ transport system membrane component KefB
VIVLAFVPAGPVAGHQLLVFLLQVSLLLLLALCLGQLATKLGVPAVVGELLTGVLLGPSLLGHVAPGVSGWLLPTRANQTQLLDVVSQMGAWLLVGVIGAQLDLSMLRRRGATIARVGLSGLLLPLALGLAVGYVLPASLMAGSASRTTFALLIGVAMSVSAIPVIAKTLSDMNLLYRDIGQLTLSAGMIADVVGWALLSVVSVLAVGGPHPGRIVVSLLYLVGFITVVPIVGRPVVRWVFRCAARSRDDGPTLAAAVVVILLGAAIAQALRLEAVFGAFVAGALVGAPGAAEPARLVPLRTVVLSVFAPLFLAAAGLRMDLAELGRPAILLASAVLILLAVAGKFAGAYIGARISGLSRWEGVALGAGINARGVVEVVVAMVGLRLGVLTDAMYTIVVLIAIVTSLMAPPVLRLAMAHVDYSDEERLREPEAAATSGGPG